MSRTYDRSPAHNERKTMTMNDEMRPIHWDGPFEHATDDDLIRELESRGYHVERRSLVALPDPIDQFNDFWDRYPRKVGKKAARKAWDKLDGDQRAAALAAILEHVRVWAAEGRSSAHVPHASTWLNGEHWEDELTYVPPTAPMEGPAGRSSGVLERLAAKEIGR